MKTRATLPFELDVAEPEPHVVSAIIPRQCFSDPFLVDTLTGRLGVAMPDPDPMDDQRFVRHLKYAANTDFIVRSPISTFVSSQDEPDVPIAFVFHMGRSGSTLLSQMLATSQSAFVLSEPTLINRLLDPTLTALSSDARREAASAAIKAYAACRPPGTARVVFKFRSWNILFADHILSAFPNAQIWFVHRNAVEVWASLKRSPPGWLRSGGRLSFGDLSEYPDDRTECEYAAAVLGQLCMAARKLERLGCQFIDYTDIVSSFPQLAANLGVSLSKRDRRVAIERSRTYSKSLAGVPFETDSVLKQSQISPAEAAVLIARVECHRSRLNPSFDITPAKAIVGRMS